MLADFVYDPAQSLVAERVKGSDGRSAVFAARRENAVAITPEVVRSNGAVMHPYPLDHRLLADIPLPVGIGEEPKDGDLFQQVRAVFEAGHGFEPVDVTTLSAWVLASWVADGLDFLPLVVLQGPPASGRSWLLRLLASLTRRPLVLDRFRASVYALLRLLTPTLLFDYTIYPPGRADAAFLAAGTERRLRAASAQGPVRLFGPRVVAYTEPGHAQSLEGRAIIINLPRMPQITQGQAASDTRALLPQLAAFRLQKFAKVEPRLPTAPMTISAARSWGVLRPFVPDAYGSELDQFFLDPRRGAADPLPPEARAVLSALMRLAHGSVPSIQVGGLADAANVALERLGEPAISARKAGAILKTLGIQRDDLRDGRFVIMNLATKARIHELAGTYSGQLPISGDGTETCPDCIAVGLIPEPERDVAASNDLSGQAKPDVA